MLFENHRQIDSIKLVEFIRWARESFNWEGGQPPANGVLALPPIQRNAAWGPRQVVDVWDSVLRGLPLGTFMLLPRDAGKLARRMGTDAPNEATVQGWDLLDGQQRLRSLLLGFYGPNLDTGMIDKRCLWIDLDAEPAHYLFKVHLTSASQPFGYDENGYKLPLDQRRAARNRFEIVGQDNHVVEEIRADGRHAYNHELFGGFVAKDPPLYLAAGEEQKPMPPETYPGYPDHCWPPVPAGIELDHKTYLASNGRTIMPLHVLLQPWIETLRKGVEDAEDALAPFLSQQHQRRPLFLAALKRLSEAELPLINASAVTGANLPLLYDRIGAGGTPLSNEERLFSLYKYHQPKFHNIVRHIYEECGRVMVPSKIAASAIRIANAIAYQRRDLERGNPRPHEGNGLPDVNQFASTIERNAEDQNGVNLRRSLDELLGIDQEPAADEKPFSKAFIRLFTALRYDKETNSLGLPKVLLWHLPPNLIHVLLFWHLQQRTDDPPCNNDLIRFTMFWLLCPRSDDKISNLCFRRVRESLQQGNQVSLKVLFHAIKEDSSLSRELIDPDKMKNLLVSSDMCEWRSLRDRIGNSEFPVAELVERWWRDQNNFLPWLQRAYLDAAFPEYDPTSDREDDTPYDVDHMVPNSDCGFYWWDREARLPNLTEDQRNRLRWVRSEIGNSIGNKWLVDGSINRAWGNISFTQKWEDINELAGRQLALRDLFEEDNLQLWQTASPRDPPNPNPWNLDRRENYQLAVESRAAWLYRCLYDGLGFREWAQ
jgi:Protein of unknown function DUF262